MTKKIDYSKNKIAAKGRDGDQFLAHIAPGEMIVPPVISPELKAQIYAQMEAAGINPAEYEANGGEYSINPETGLPEFGFFSKLFKVVKKVAPVALSFVPGIGPLAAAGLGAGIGALGGGGLKGAISGALGAASGGIGNYIGSGISGITGLSSIASNAIGRGLTSAAGSKIGGGSTTDALLSGGLSGLGSLYKAGAFNNLGKSFNESGFSGAINQLGDNIAGKGDVLGSTANAVGGGSSSYSNSVPASQVGVAKDATILKNGDTISWNNPTATPAAPTNLFDKIVNSTPDAATGESDMAINKQGLSSILNAGIGTYSNNKAANQLLKMQKQGLSDLQPYLNQTFQPTDLENDAGYQFELKQGQKGIDSAAAARGNYFSGDALRSAGEYATGLANTHSADAYNRWANTRQSNIQALLQKYGILADIGNTKAGKTMANSNVLTQSLNNYLNPQSSLEQLVAKYMAARA